MDFGDGNSASPSSVSLFSRRSTVSESSESDEDDIPVCTYYKPTLRDYYITLPDVWKRHIITDSTVLVQSTSVHVNPSVFEYLINPAEPLPGIFWPRSEKPEKKARERKTSKSKKSPSAKTPSPPPAPPQNQQGHRPKSAEKENFQQVDLDLQPQSCDADNESDNESWCSDNRPPSPPALAKELLQKLKIQDEKKNEIESSDEEDFKMKEFRYRKTKVEVLINGSRLQKDYGQVFWFLIPHLDGMLVELYHQLESAIALLGGVAIAKFCWVAPKDARALGLNKSLACYHPSDIIQFFKNSYRISEAFTRHQQNYEGVADFLEDNSEYSHELNYFHNQNYICLTQWMKDVKPDEEFRCFVINKKLAAICQRNCHQGYPAIYKFAGAIIKDIHDVYRKYIVKKFPLDYYVFDVVRRHGGGVTILDFGVFGKSSCLAWSYHTFLSQYENMEEAINKQGSGGGLIGVEKYGLPSLNAIQLADLEMSQDPALQTPLPLCLKELSKK